MTTVHPGGPAVNARDLLTSRRAFRSALRAVSLFTMATTVPQVVAVWRAPGVSGVSLVSWLSYLVSAVLWLVYGIRRHDKTIYLACIGWIVLDSAVVLGVVAHGA